MKTFTISVIIILASLGQGYAQNLFTTSYIEKTKVSPKAGIQVGYQFASKHEIGLFYQKEVDMLGGHESIKPRFYEKEFLGVSVSSQLYSFQKIDMILNVRIGVINKENFALTPSFKMDYEVIQRIHIQAGLGVRSFNPTLQGGIKIDIY